MRTKGTEIEVRRDVPSLGMWARLGARQQKRAESRKGEDGKWVRSPAGACVTPVLDACSWQPQSWEKAVRLKDASASHSQPHPVLWTNLVNKWLSMLLATLPSYYRRKERIKTTFLCLFDPVFLHLHWCVTKQRTLLNLVAINPLV